MARKGVKKAISKVKKLANAINNLNINESAGRKVGGSIGRALGNSKRGQAIGGKVGKLAQYVGRVAGSGDYVVSGNVLSRQSQILGGSVPSFSRNSESTIIEHREYVGDVISSATPGAFSVVKYAFNPTNQALFPWLNSIALSYDQWEPLGAVLTFKSTSADYNGTSQALGTVIIASDYDVYDATYTSKTAMENSVYGVSCRSSESMLHPIECDPRQRPTRLLYTGPPDNVSDKRFHDLCSVQVGTAGVSVASVNLGELWISYKIRFHKPQIILPPVFNLSSSFTPLDNNSATNFWGTRSLISTFGTNNLNGLITFATASAGVAVIEFTDSSTWGRAYLLTGRFSIPGIAAGPTSVSAAGFDSQLVVKYSQTSVVVANTANGDVLECYAFVSVKRDTSIITPPQLRWTFSYTATNNLQSGIVTISEIDTRQLLTF